MAWYAVRSKPCAETQASQNITAAGLEAFVPFLRTDRGSIVPLFSRYLFVSAVNRDRLTPVYSARGVCEIVGPPLRQMPVRPGLIESLIEIQTARGDFVVDEMPADTSVIRPSFTAGQQVRVISGAYAGAVTTLLQARGNTGRLMLALFGAERPVTVKLDQLAAA